MKVVARVTATNVSVCVFVYVGAFVTRCVCVRLNARGMLSMYHVSHSICTYVWMHVCVCVVLWNAQLKQIWILILFKYLIPIWLKPDCRKWRSVSLPLSHSLSLRPLPQYVVRPLHFSAPYFKQIDLVILRFFKVASLNSDAQKEERGSGQAQVREGTRIQQNKLVW